MKELQSSIERQGVIHPLVVRKKGDKYEVIAGSRRYYASKSLGLKRLPVIEKKLEDKDALVFSLIENLQRQDLNPMEEAMGFKRLKENFDLSYEEISKAVGKDRTTVVNAFRLLSLPEEIGDAVRDRRISASQARTLLSLKTEKEQLDFFDRLLKENIPVRELEKQVRSRKKRKKMKKSDPFVADAESNLQKILGRKVKIFSSGKKGKCVIEYYSLQDLEQLINTLTKGGL